MGLPPPPPSRQVGQRQPKPPSRHGNQGGGGGVGQMGFRHGGDVSSVPVRDSPPPPPWGPSAHFYWGGESRTEARRRPPRGFRAIPPLQSNFLPAQGQHFLAQAQALLCTWAALHCAGRPENCFAGGGGWHGRPAKEEGGVPEMGFRAGPFVLCKDGCCHQRRRNTNFGSGNFFHEKIFPHICVVKMISATWGSF